MESYMRAKTLSSDTTDNMTCPFCGYRIDSTDIPWPKANNYAEFECIECEQKIWAEWEPMITIGKMPQ